MRDFFCNFSFFFGFFGYVHTCCHRVLPCKVGCNCYLPDISILPLSIFFLLFIKIYCWGLSTVFVKSYNSYFPQNMSKVHQNLDVHMMCEMEGVCFLGIF
jgi:hypothetical protein